MSKVPDRYEEVHDVEWYVNNSTVIGTVTGGGRMQIWDLSYSVVAPVAEHQVPNA
jgi:dynein intermediate chain 4, axonemal